MGQTYAGCVDAKFQDAGCDACRIEDTCTAAMTRHVLQAEAPSSKVGAANCMLLHASRDGDLDAIHRAMADGADPDTRLPMYIRMGSLGGNAGEPSSVADSALSLTPLMYAAHDGHAEAVELLLRFGAKVDLYEADGMQALHFAALSASVDCFRILLGAGANPVAADNFGRDALECVPLSEVAASPSHGEWLQLFREVHCCQAPQHDSSSLQLAPLSASGCETRPDEEEANQTELTSDTEKDSEEANVSREILVTFINKQPNEMEGLHNAERKLSHGSEASTESDLHFDECSNIRSLKDDSTESEFGACQGS